MPTPTPASTTTGMITATMGKSLELIPWTAIVSVSLESAVVTVVGTAGDEEVRYSEVVFVMEDNVD